MDQTANSTGFEHGDKVKYLGLSQDKRYAGFIEFVYLEGHREGQKGWALSAEEGASDAAKKQAEFKDQQAAFSRLKKLQREVGL